jgi:hypothetical protein
MIAAAVATAMQLTAGESASSQWCVHPAHCTVQVPGQQQQAAGSKLH